MLKKTLYYWFRNPAETPREKANSLIPDDFVGILIWGHAPQISQQLALNIVNSPLLTLLNLTLILWLELWFLSPNACSGPLRLAIWTFFLGLGS